MLKTIKSVFKEKKQKKEPVVLVENKNIQNSTVNNTIGYRWSLFSFNFSKTPPPVATSSVQVTTSFVEGDVAIFLEDSLNKAIKSYNDNDPLKTIEILENCRSLKRSGNSVQQYNFNKYLAKSYVAIEEPSKSIFFYQAAYNGRVEDVEEEASIDNMFALLLDEDYDGAWAFGVHKIKEYPQNVELAAYLIIASQGDSSKDPRKFIAEELYNTQEVILGQIRLAQKTNGNWQELSYENYAKFPDNILIKECYAQAICTQIADDLNSLGTMYVTPEQLQQIKEILPIFNELWTKRPKMDNIPISFLNIFVSLIELNYLAGDKDKVISLVREVYKNANLPEHVVMCSIHKLIDYGEFEIIKEFAYDITQTPDLYFYCLVNQKDEHLADLTDESIGKMSLAEQNGAKVSRFFALHKKENKAPQEKDVLDLFAIAANNPMVSLLLAYRCNDYELWDLVDKALELAVSLLKNDTPLKIREMIAEFATEKIRYDIVIQSLASISPRNISEVSIYKLCYAYSRKLPVSHEAISYVENLPRQLYDKLNFQNILAVIYLNCGDCLKAEKLLEKVSADSLHDSSLLILYAVCLGKQYKEKELEELFERVQIVEINTNNETYAIQLAMLLIKYRKSLEAFAFCYKLLHLYPNNVEIQRVFIFSILSDNSNLFEMSHISKDSYFRLRNQEGGEIDCLACNDNDVLPEFNVLTSGELIELALGKGKNDKFIQERMDRFSFEWTIIDIKHKFIYAFECLSNTIEKKFGKEAGMMQLSVDLSDPTSFIQMLEGYGKSNKEKQKQFEKNLISFYSKDKIPLCILPQLAKTSMSKIMKILIQSSVIHSSLSQSYDKQQTLLEAYNQKNVVIDAYTLFIASTSGILQDLAGYFKEIIISHNTLYHVADMLMQPNLLSDANFSYSIEGGELLPKEKQKNAHEIFNRAFDDVKKYCTIKPIIQNNEFINDEEQIFGMIGTDYFEFRWLVEQHDALLLSEDGNYSMLHPHLHNATLSTAVSYLFNQKNIDEDSYLNSIDFFVYNSHKTMLFDSKTAYLFYQYDNGSLSRFSAYIKHLLFCVPNDVNSILNFLYSLFDMIWSIPPIRTEDEQKIVTVCVLDICFSVYKNDMGNIIAWFLIRSHAKKGLSSCIEDWYYENIGDEESLQQKKTKPVY